MAVSDWSATAALNTSLGGIDITGSGLVSNGDNAIRELMAQVKAGVPFLSSGAYLLESDDAGASAGPVVNLYRNSATPAASDILGKFLFNGEDSAGNTQEYASIEVVIEDATSTSEDGRIDCYATIAGVRTKVLSLGTAAGLQAAWGGTGITSYTAGDMLYASGATALSKLAKGTYPQVMQMNPGATAPEWADKDTLTLLGTANTSSGSSQTVSGMATTYRKLLCVLNVSTATLASVRVALSANGTDFGTPIQITTSIQSDNAVGMVEIWNANKAGASKIVMPWNVASSSGSPYATPGTEASITGLITALRFSPSTGNFDNGSITVYGVT